MFEMELRGDDTVVLVGRFDAAQVEEATSVFDRIERSCTVDFEKLEYISSAGLSVLLAAQKRLRSTGNQLRLRNCHPSPGPKLRQR